MKPDPRRALSHRRPVHAPETGVWTRRRFSLDTVMRSNGGTSRHPLWSQPTKRNPNSTSIDSAGSYVTVADGYPDQAPGDYYLFKSDGTLAGSFATSNMSWPMQISADASAIAAGSDDSNVYYCSTGA
jgi:hypothetical protein